MNKTIFFSSMMSALGLCFLNLPSQAKVVYYQCGQAYTTQAMINAAQHSNLPNTHIKTTGRVVQKDSQPISESQCKSKACTPISAGQTTNIPLYARLFQYDENGKVVQEIRIPCEDNLNKLNLTTGGIKRY